MFLHPNKAKNGVNLDSLRLHGLRAAIGASIFFSVFGWTDPKTAALLAPLLPIITLGINLRYLHQLLDYRIVHLLGLTFWGGSKTIGLIGSGGVEFYANGLSWYTVSMAIASLVPHMFKYNATILIEKTRTVIYQSGNNRHIILTMALAIPLIPFINRSWALQEDVVLMGMGYSVAQGVLSALLSTMVIHIMSNQASTVLRMLCIVVIICSLSVYMMLGINRTMLLLPAVSLGLSSLLAYTVRRKRIQMSTDIMIAVCAMPFMLLILLVADVQKKSGRPITQIVKNEAEFREAARMSLFESTYYGRDEDAINYFSTLEDVASSRSRSFGFGFLQLITIVAPREFFPAKPDFDVSRIAYKEGVVGTPLYYEIFLEQWLDCGVIGVAIYHTAFLLMGVAFLRLVGVPANNSWFEQYAIGSYLVCLITIFYAIRGPIITIAWFCSSPFAIAGVLSVLRYVSQNFLLSRPAD